MTDRRELDDAVREAAGAIAMMDAVPAPDPSDPSDVTAVEIELLAPESGAITLSLPDDHARLIGRVAWGARGDGSDEQLFQVLFEMANVVAGRYLTARHPDSEVRIGFPRRLGADEPRRGAVATYDLEGLQLSVHVS